MALIIGFFITLLHLSKRGYYRTAAIIYLLALFLIATYPVVHWVIALPQGVLTYCSIIVVAAVLLNARAAFILTGAATVMLLFVECLNATNMMHFDTDWMKTTGGYNDVIVYATIFSIVALVSWLSDRQIELSLQRSRQSEMDLRLERNMLKARVNERTQELERAHVEMLEELNRFAEFGRISSTLLHELANPLTSAMLHLELLKNKRTSKLYKQLHEIITCMEEYVTSARRQLRQQSDVCEFNAAKEIQRVTDFLQPKARAMQVEIYISLDKNLTLIGDSVKFSQILSNLLANAIDSYETIISKTSRPIEVTLQQLDNVLVVSVTDYGIGISRKAIKHIFESFYTTKPVGRGTGLGLSITKRTVEEDFGGTIAVTSSPQKGTLFMVRIPLP